MPQRYRFRDSGVNRCRGEQRESDIAKSRHLGKSPSHSSDTGELAVDWDALAGRLSLCSSQSVSRPQFQGCLFAAFRWRVYLGSFFSNTMPHLNAQMGEPFELSSLPNRWVLYRNLCRLCSTISKFNVNPQIHTRNNILIQDRLPNHRNPLLVLLQRLQQVHWSASPGN